MAERFRILFRAGGSLSAVEYQGVRLPVTNVSVDQDFPQFGMFGGTGTRLTLCFDNVEVVHGYEEVEGTVVVVDADVPELAAGPRKIEAPR